MKTLSAASMALLSLAQLISAAPSPSSLQIRDAATANTTFVLAAVIAEPPNNIAVDNTSGLYVETQNGPPESQQRFIYDPTTNGVVLAHGPGEPVRIVYVGPDGHWAVTNGTITPQGSSTVFQIQKFEQGHDHDNDLELKAYRSSDQPIANDYECQDSTGKMALYSSDTATPPSCYGGYLGLMVTTLAS